MNRIKERINIDTPVNILLLTLLIAPLSFFMLLLVGSIIAIPLFGIDPSFLFSPSRDYADPSVIPVMKYFQILQTTGLFVLPPLLVAIVLQKRIGHFLKLNQRPSGRALIYSILLIFASSPVIFYIGEWNAHLHFPEWLSGLEKWLNQTDQKTDELIEVFLNTTGIRAFLLNLIMIAVLPALGEEFMFRGIIQQQLSRFTQNKHIGIIISAILFSILHMQFSGFFPRFFLGAIFGYLFLWSGSLWLPIAVHFVNNASALIAHKQFVDSPMDPISSGNNFSYPYSITILSLIISATLLWAIYKLPQNESRKY